MSADGELRRAIGPAMLFFFVLGDVLGGGIYALVGEVGGEVGGAFWTAFLAAFALALLTAGSYAELVTKYPNAGGAAYFVHRAFGCPWLSFLIAFAVLASGVTSAAALARAFGGDYLTVFVDLPAVPVGFAFLATMAAVNARGVRESVRLNVGLTLIELAGLLLVATIAVAAIAGGVADTARPLEFRPGSSPALSVVAGAAVAFYALIGFEDAANVAEETERPGRAYPLALFGGLAAAGALYVVIAVLTSMVVPVGELAGSSGPLLEVVQRGPLAVDTRVFAFVALFAVANGALINLIMASRLLYGMGREQVVPRAFARLHPTRRTPSVAIVFTAALAAVLVVTGDLGTLARTTVTLLLWVFALVNASVLVLRRERVPHPHLRVPRAVPVLGAVASLGLLTQPAPGIHLRAALLLALGGVLWVIQQAVARRR
jgi:basic amino acid/polyamine antiporter, APA family